MDARDSKRTELLLEAVLVLLQSAGILVMEQGSLFEGGVGASAAFDGVLLAPIGLVVWARRRRRLAPRLFGLLVAALSECLLVVLLLHAGSVVLLPALAFALGLAGRSWYDPQAPREPPPGDVRLPRGGW